MWWLLGAATAQDWLQRAPAAAPAAGGSVSTGPLWGNLSPGAVQVANGTQLLQALQDNVGDITLAGERGRGGSLPCRLHRRSSAHSARHVLPSPRPACLHLSHASPPPPPPACLPACLPWGAADRVALAPADWEAFELPLRIRSNATVLIHSADDSGINVRPRTLDWGAAQNLLVVEEGATLALVDLISANPGNFTLADSGGMVLKNNGAGRGAAPRGERLPGAVGMLGPAGLRSCCPAHRPPRPTATAAGSFIWPTVTALNNSSIVISDSTLFHDDPRCSPETVEVRLAGGPARAAAPSLHL